MDDEKQRRHWRNEKNTWLRLVMVGEDYMIKGVRETNKIARRTRI